MNKTIMITGANAGIGKEVARQLALLSGTEKVYLACRNEQKAQTAKKELEGLTGKSIFEIVIMDVSNPQSVKAAVASLSASLDALIMNAGGMGGTTPMNKTKEGVTQIFATNLLGHVVLLEELLQEKKLQKVALYVGSEAARGVAKLGIKAPGLQTSSVAEFVGVADGSFFAGRKINPPQAYGQVKYAGALWMAFLARKYPEIRFITMSPGNTAGTEITSNAPPPLRILMKYVLMPVVMPLLKIVHPVQTGAKRIIDGINDESLRSGTFYASQETALIGPVVDQSTFFPDLNNESYQDNANEAIHRFIS